MGTLGTNLEGDNIRDFRVQVKRVREFNRPEWEATRKIVAHSQLDHTLSELARKVEESSLDHVIKEKLLQSLKAQKPGRGTDLSFQGLKELTGLPTTKAIRALCVLFSVGREEPTQKGKLTISPAKIEEILLQSSNPYDLLLTDGSPSLLDLGAGDLTFEQELVDLYLPKLRGKGSPLVLHAIDRLQPGSQVGGVYHANQTRKHYLEGISQEALRYGFWGGVDLTALSNMKKLQPHYTLVTCHAPANPTFAFEPSRLSQETINRRLRASRGEFRKRKLNGEDVLEVIHEGRVLTFPPWKFDIVGPLVLLDVMTRRGGLCLLTSMDGEVFWETLAQLLEDERFRPRDIIFSPSTLKEVFGSIYSELTQMPIGGKISLTDLAKIRTSLPQAIQTPGLGGHEFRLRYVEIRRGATFEGLPCSFTSRQFAHMKEEEPPWWIIIVPEEM